MIVFGAQPKIAEVTGQELVQQLNQASPPFILDVRTPQEFGQGHIPGAVLIPVTELARRIKEVPSDREIVTVCHSGNRSMMAAKQLSQAGYRVKNLQHGMMRWPGPTE
jgi:rhodanese-related sulfurtransferase